MPMPPDQLMEMIKSQKDAATPGGVPSVPDAPMSAISDQGTPPMGSPMSTPEPKEGNREAAMINLGMAADLLEQSLHAFGSETPEGQKLLGAIRSLSGLLGTRKNKTNELQQTEIMQLMQSLPKAGGAPPPGAPPGAGMPPMGMPPGAPPGGAPPMPPMAGKPPGMPPPPGGGMPPPM